MLAAQEETRPAITIARARFFVTRSTSVRNRGRVIDRLELLTQLAHACQTDPPFAARLLSAADGDYARRNIVRPSPATARQQGLHASLAVALGQRELAHRLDEGAGSHSTRPSTRPSSTSKDLQRPCSEVA